MTWSTVNLEDVCTFENGDRGKNYPNKSEMTEAGIPFVNAGDLTDGTINSSGLSFISDEHYNRLSNGKFRRGDFLFCLRGTLGKFAAVDRDIRGAIASSLIIIRPTARIHSAYLNSYLRSDLCKTQIGLFENGAAQPNLSAASLKKFEVPLPPLDEQKRIAAILDQADALRRLRTRALDRLNAFGQAIFHEMFGGHDCEKVTLSSISRSIDYGLTASASETASGPKFLRITDIQDGSVDWSNVPRCIASEREAKSNALHVGDIVFARTGATTGKSFLISEVPEAAVFASYLIRVKPDDKVVPPYLFEFFQTADYWRQITLMSVGAAQPGVNSSKLRELVVPLPPISEQFIFTSRIAEIEKRKKWCKSAIALSDALFTSLQHRAFRGEL